ncbi:hypothetical protein ABPG72_007245 [Tetrahymena utriculariae]
MNNLEGFRNHTNLKDILQVKIKPMHSYIQVNKQSDIVMPVMIDIRTQTEKPLSNQLIQNDDDLTKSCTPTSSQASCNIDIDRQPLDLIFVIDLSISMRGKKMNQLKKTICNLINFFNENDRMALIGFNNSAQNLFPLSHLTQQNKKKVTQILNSILPMGLTNITAGMMEAIKQLESSLINISTVDESGECEEDEKATQVHNEKRLQQDMQSQESKEKYKDLLSRSEVIKPQSAIDYDLSNSCINFGQKKEERVKSIFLLSDGLDDRCDKSLEMLKVRIQSVPIQFSLNTFGYGEQHDAYLMNEIASYKEGNFYYIEDIDKTDLYFADALGGLFSVVGNQLEFDFSLCSQALLENITISKVYGDMWNQTNGGVNNASEQIFCKSSNNSSNQSNKYNFGSDSPSQLAKNIIDQVNHRSEQHSADQFVTNINNNQNILNQNCNRLLSDNNNSQTSHFANQTSFTKKSVNLTADFTPINAIVKNRSFNLNQIYFGVSKQILLEITIPSQLNFPNNLQQNDASNNNFENDSQSSTKESYGQFKKFSECFKNQVLATGKLKVKDLHGQNVEKTAHLEVIILEENEEINEEVYLSNEDVEINYLRVQCAQALQDAMNSALKSEYNQSQSIINKALEQLQKSKISIQKALANLQKDLEECLEALKQKISLQQSSNPNSQSQLSYSSSHSTQDQKECEQEKAHNIRRAFLCKSRAYMEQKSVMINLDEYQNSIQKNIKKQIEIQNQKKVFSAEEEEKEKETEKPVKAKKILIPLQRKKFSSMNVAMNEISSIDEQK